jgi:isoquinoline 1-oxidoreductase beta subunit
MDRREFLVATAIVGGGMALRVIGAPPRALAKGQESPLPINPQPWLPPAPGGVEVGPWVVIGADSSVTVRVNQSEMGQGVFTSNAMMICEELDCDWSRVRAVYADANRSVRENGVYGRMATGTSASVRRGRVLYQQAGASARERLRLAAAQHWNVPSAEVETANGVLTHTPTRRTLTYGEVAPVAATIALIEEPAIKTPAQYKLIGRRVRMLDTELKVYGQATYGIDVRLPGMVYAATKQPPTYGGTLKRFHFDAIKNRPGVIAVMRMDGIGPAGGVAVVADTWWRARTALDALPIEWDSGPNATKGSPDLYEEFRAKLDEPGPIAVDQGDAESILRSASRVVEAVYETAHQAHATMEPPNCTAQVTGDRADVWLGVQDPAGALNTVARLTGLSAEKVYVHNCFEGGGFGAGGTRGELAQAVVVSRALGGRPVKVLWTREEDIRRPNKYHPMVSARLRAALGPDGKPTAIWIRTVGNPLDGGLTQYGKYQATVHRQLLRGFHLLPYGVPHQRVEVHAVETWVPVGAWRSTGSHPNVFFLESFVDELAHAAGKDPIDYRRALIAAAAPESFEDHAKDDWLRTLDVAAEKSGWGQRLPRGTGMGFAIDDRKAIPARGLAIGAIVARVSVAQTGTVSVERIDIVYDQGHALINPEAVERQLRGQIAWSMGPAMTQEITFRNGGVVESNFHDYPMIRLAEFPKQVHIHYVKTKRWISGVGEEIVPLVTPAIYNAIFAATGKRIRNLPIRDQLKA